LRIFTFFVPNNHMDPTWRQTHTQFILQSFYLSSQNALTVYLQVINGHWPFITFRPRLLDLIDGTTFFYLWRLFPLWM
jgi:hypothetical protein